jgi:hypothetical protein
MKVLMKLKVLILSSIISFSLVSSCFAQTKSIGVASSGPTTSIRCKPIFSSTILNLIQRDIRDKFNALNVTSGDVRTYYSVSPRLKVSYVPMGTSQKISAKTLFPNIGISVTAPGTTATATVSGVSSLTNVCANTNVTIKVTGSVRRSVVRSVNGKNETERTTFPLSGQDIVISNVPAYAS